MAYSSRKEDGMFRTGKSRIFLWIIFIAFGIFFLVEIPFGTEYFSSYIVVMTSYFIIIPIYFVLVENFGIYLFEPATMVLGLTIIMFSVWPMLSIINNDTTINGFEVFDGCIIGTLVYMGSVLAFMFAYYGSLPNDNNSLFLSNNIGKVGIDEKEENSKVRLIQNHLIMNACYGFCISSIVFFCIDMLQHGYSISYMFSLGFSGTMVEGNETGGVLTTLASFMYPAFLYLDLYEDKKWRVNILRAIAFFPMVTRGTRTFIILLVLPPIVLNYVKSKKKIEIKHLIAIVVIFVFFIGALQYFRGSLRTGSGIQEREGVAFDLSYIYSAFSGNFDMYKTLYAAVQYFPSKHSFTWGQRIILCTLIHFIPSAIWSGKPSDIISQLSSAFMGPQSGAWTISQLTEYYIEFSSFGCIVIMFIFGRWCRWLKRRFLLMETDEHGLVFYSIMFVFLFQLVMRGSTHTNLWTMLFMCIPIKTIQYIDNNI